MSFYSRRSWLTVALALLGVSSGAQGQGLITIAAGDGTPLRVEAGAVVAVPMIIDMSAAGAGNLASLSTGVLWSSTFLRFDSLKAGSFGSLTSNLAGASAGVAVLSAFTATGITSTTGLATLYFTASAVRGGSRVTPVPYTAGDELGANVLASVRPRGLDVCVAAPGFWGDANGDGSVDILDAQQIARFTIGLSLASAAALRGQGDVNDDGAVNIIDAQQIARYSIELPSAPRVNTRTLMIPEVSSVTPSAPSATVQVGRSVQLTVQATDSAGAPLLGCAPITWSSSDVSKATVDQSGVVIGLVDGLTEITATSGAASARIELHVGVGATPAAMSIVRGDGQYRRSGRYGVKPQVSVVDANSRPVPGVSVRFTANSGGTVTPDSGTAGASVTVVTDSSGIAEIAGWSGGGTPVAGQTTGEGSVLQTAERVVASVSEPGVPPVTITGISLESESGASICMLTLAGSAYCQGEYVGRSIESFADTTVGSVPVPVQNGVPMASLSPGFYGEYSCGVAKTGEGYCWGWNHAGQLGDGTQNRSAGMRRVAGGLSFIKIASGHTHTCGITTTGTPYCWGLDQYGELGDGTMGGISTTPVQVLGNALMLDIATTANATCGVTTGGETWCWGSAPFVDSTLAAFSTPKRIAGAPVFTKIALGTTVACGLASDGDVNCWGAGGPGQGDGSSDNHYSNFSAVRLPSRARDLWGNFNSFCASAVDGGLYCWGANSLADIAGVGDNAPHSVPALVGYVNVARGQKQIGGFCYQSQDNQPYCFGRYAIGDGASGASEVPRYSPVAVKWVEGESGVPAALTIVAGDRQSAAVNAAVAVAPSVKVRDFAGNAVAGASVTFAVTAGGGVLTGATVTTDANGVATVGSWTLGPELGTNIVKATASGVSVAISARATAAPAYFTIADGDNQVQSGIAAGSQSTTGYFPAPLTVRVLDASERPISDVAVTFANTGGTGDFRGQATTVVPTDANGYASVTWVARGTQTQTVTASVAGIAPLTFTGTAAATIFDLTRCALGRGGRAYCWGDNRRGQVGDGTTTNRLQPTPVSGGLVFTSIAEGAGDHACGLTPGGQAYCWGANSFGQLGDETTTDRSTPVPVATELTFTKLVVAEHATCGLTNAQAIVCWGWSGFGLFGDGVRGTIRSPTFVNAGDYTYTDIALGGFHACALAAGGEARCWGNGIGGELGDGTFDIRSTPARVSGGQSFTSIATGNFYTCALTAAGEAYCWGASLGTNVATPTRVAEGLTFTSISPSGSSHTCARSVDAAVYCWGFGTNGQLGTGNTSTQPTPVPILSGVSFASISTRNGSGCGFVASGQPYCWGTNAQGQLGDGTVNQRLVPVATKWPEGTTGVPVSLAINSGNGQSAQVGMPVTPPSVIVKDYAGTPLVGTIVTFTVTSGDGTVGTATATTNGLGIATVDSWTLGPVPGTNTLTVTAPGLPTVIITATGTPGGGE